jgi:hypothetical protein
MHFNRDRVQYVTVGCGVINLDPLSTLYEWHDSTSSGKAKKHKNLHIDQRLL